jgi:hypothetical protein
MGFRRKANKITAKPPVWVSEEDVIQELTWLSEYQNYYLKI